MVKGMEKAKNMTYDFKLIFEEEYLYDKLWIGKKFVESNNIKAELKIKDGLIKEYNYNGKIIFEGEYLHGKRNGKGKEYDDFQDILIFEGEYLNGLRNGKGKEYDYKGNLIFEGEYFYDKE